MKKDDSVYLRHILDAMSRIEEYTQDLKYDGFMDNYLIQDGVIRQIEIIGEATRRLSKEIKEKHPEIPWKDMSGMRDKLIHDYFGVDIDTVWDTVEKDIPALKNILLKKKRRSDGKSSNFILIKNSPKALSISFFIIFLIFSSEIAFVII
jgi:uncharacterized protein with HEPN domain